MTLNAWFRRVFRRASAAGRVPAAGMEQAEAWLAAMEAGRLNPPRDLHDRDAWDAYWMKQLEVGAMEQGFADRMSSDTSLPVLFARRGSRTILCAGNGLSTEAISLALHGFDVTALDLSAVPGNVFGRMLLDAEHPLRRIPGFSSRDDGSVTFAAAGSIDPELCPFMHRSAEYPPRSGGSLSLATGDLIDPEVCPGPFDVVIERRTLQLFPEAERRVALDRLVARLADRGVFVSQEHQGGWKPDEDRTHHAEAWLVSRGFALHESHAGARLAYLMFTSG